MAISFNILECADIILCAHVSKMHVYTISSIYILYILTWHFIERFLTKFYKLFYIGSIK